MAESNNSYFYGNTGLIKSYVWEDIESDTIKIFIVSHSSDLCLNRTQYAMVFENDFPTWKPYQEGEKIPPLLVISEMGGAKMILSALAKALGEAGFLPEVDNKERITAQAVAEERKEEIGYLRSKIDFVFDKLVKEK